MTYDYEHYCHAPLYTLYVWRMEDQTPNWQAVCQCTDREYVEGKAIALYPEVRGLRIYNPQDELVLERWPHAPSWVLEQRAQEQRMRGAWTVGKR